MVSGFKKSNNKKIVFAKDKKQIYTMIAVFVLFGCSIIYMLKELEIIQFPTPASTNQDESVQSGGVLGLPPEEQGGAVLAGASGLSPEEQGIGNPAGNPGLSPEEQSGNISATQTEDISNISSDAQSIYQKTIELKNRIRAQEGDTLTDVQILPSKQTKSKGKTISIMVDNSINKENPFLPASYITSQKITVNKKIPGKITYPVSVLPPPIGTGYDTQANDLMNVEISGIMYDAFSPSAVIKVNQVDYLVKKGDIIKGYKILDIKQEFVRIQLGKNIYSGYVGQLLKISDVDFSQNISNLNSKFGGSSVTIRVKKTPSKVSSKPSKKPSKKTNNKPNKKKK